MWGDTTFPGIDAKIKIMIALWDGEKRPQDILRVAMVSKATFHRVVEMAIQEGLLQKRYDPTKYPPRVYYSLTEKGKIRLKEELKQLKPKLKEMKRQIDLFLEIAEGMCSVRRSILQGREAGVR